MTSTQTTDAPKKAPRGRAPLPSVDATGTTSAVDALAGPPERSDAVQLLDVAPATLTVRDQVRQDATPDDALVASVRKWGLLQPPTVVREVDDASRLVIVTGHRRVGAAIAAGLDTITVILRPAAAAADAELLEQQIVENERREALSSAELAQGWAELEGLFGLSPEDIAVVTGEKPERVRAGIRAVRSEKTGKLLEETPEADLEQLAVLTEFEDSPKILNDLVETLRTRPHNFATNVEYSRQQVAKATRQAELKAEIKEQGVKLAPVDTYGMLKGKARRITSLYTPKGKSLTPASHAKCAGHRAFVAGYSLDTYEIEYACLDPQEYGHTDRKVDPEAEAERARAEQERAERQARIEANRTARRQWIHDLLPGKINQLAGVYAYMAAALLDRSGYYYDDTRAPLQTLQLLDALPNPDQGGTVSPTAATAALNDLVAGGRVAPFRLMLATALGIHEKRCEEAKARPGIRHYEQLQRWGYQLTDVDQEALDSWRAAVAAEDERDAEGEAD